MTNEEYKINISIKNNIIVATFFDGVMGVGTIDKNNFPENQKDEFMLKVFGGMGFDSAQEYIKLYPGHYLALSKECKAMLSSSLNPYARATLEIHIKNDINNAEIFRAVNCFCELNMLYTKKDVLNKLLSGNYEFIPIVQPTTQELIEAGSVESDMSDFLCICSDWKEK